MDVDDVDGRLLSMDSKEMAGGYHREFGCAKDGFTGRVGSWNLDRKPAKVITLIRRVVGMPYCIVQPPYWGFKNEEIYYFILFKFAWP